ncbi:MAG: inositol monophosphatase family protein [Anaerolineales bacterium]|jgi:myo-inositol-1(or 4)-monophosphatase
MLESRLMVAKSLALQAGAVLREAYAGEKVITHKGRIDLLTNFDLQSEGMLVQGLREAFPDDSIVAEEAHFDPGHEAYWLIDPIDGTTNFAHGLPDFTICLAYIQAGNPQLGIIYNPARGELYTALRDGGAYLNETPIHVSQQLELEQSLLSAGFPYDPNSIDFDVFDAWQRIFYRSQGIRHIGCASMNPAYVASGVLEAFWEEGFQPWDLAAGILLVTEAGGRVSRIDGGPDPLREPCSLLASNGLLHDELLALLQHAARGDKRKAGE